LTNTPRWTSKNSFFKFTNFAHSFNWKRVKKYLQKLANSYLQHISHFLRNGIYLSVLLYQTLVIVDYIRYFIYIYHHLNPANIKKWSNCMNWLQHTSFPFYTLKTLKSSLGIVIKIRNKYCQDPDKECQQRIFLKFPDVFSPWPDD
jgi:hypothetical protein